MTVSFSRYEEYIDLQSGDSVWKTVYLISLPNGLVPVTGAPHLDGSFAASLNFTGNIKLHPQVNCLNNNANMWNQDVH